MSKKRKTELTVKRDPGTDPWNELLRRAAKASGLSVYMLAKRTGLGLGPLQRFMGGSAGLKLTSGWKLGEVVGVQLVWKAGKARA